MTEQRAGPWLEPTRLADVGARRGAGLPAGTRLVRLHVSGVRLGAAGTDCLTYLSRRIAMSELPPDQAEATGTDPQVDTSGGTHESEDYHGYSVDDEDQPQGDGDSLVDDRGLVEPLDEGYSPPEKWSPAIGYGNTPLEEEQG